MADEGKCFYSEVKKERAHLLSCPPAGSRPVGRILAEGPFWPGLSPPLRRSRSSARCWGPPAHSLRAISARSPRGGQEPAEWVPGVAKRSWGLRSADGRGQQGPLLWVTRLTCECGGHCGGCPPLPAGPGLEPRPRSAHLWAVAVCMPRRTEVKSLREPGAPVAARYFRRGLREHVPVPGTLLPGDTRSRDWRLPALLLSCSSRNGKRRLASGSRTRGSPLGSCPRASGAVGSHCPLRPGHGRAQQRGGCEASGSSCLGPPLQFAGLMHPDSYWQLTLRQRQEGKSEVGPRDPAGETWGVLAACGSTD